MKKITELKKLFAVTLAAAVLVTNVPVSAATVTFWDGDKELGSASGVVVSGNEVSGNEVSGNEVVKLDGVKAPEKDCKTFIGWEIDGKVVTEDEITVSSNAVISANAVYEDSHDYAEKVTKEATCTEAGEKALVCKKCNDAKEKVEIKALGHKWDAGKVTKEATAKAEGVKTYTCATCKATKTEAVAKLKATIKLNAKSIKLKVKQSTTAVKVSGLAKGDKVKTWKSSDTKIVKVNNKGKITATNKTGKATITVTTECGAKATLKVTVQKKAVAVTKLSVNKSKVTLTEGEKFSIVATKSPITAAQKVTYKSSDKKVATVNSKGVVTAKKAGKATITVKAGNKTKKVTITVQAKLKKISVGKTKVTLKVGNTHKIVVKKTPAKAPGKATFTSSNKKVATVNSKGVVTAKKAGKATITVKVGKLTKKVKITVKKK